MSPNPGPPPGKSSGGAFLGLLATLGPCLISVILGFTMMDAYQNVAVGLILGMSVLQFAWVIPMFRNAKRTGNERMKIGLVIGASITFLFCASCGGLLVALSNTSFH